jgi:RNA polymerase sigma factor for flagellar operon FliA
MDPSHLYVEHLDAINRIAESLCRRNGIRGADAEDFASEVRLKLLQDDYAVLRKHRGACSTTTFLTVVISNLFRDHRIKLWGKWRPSAEARRRGEAAVLLEAAVYRDGRTFEEACGVLEQHGRLNVRRDELRRLMTELPYRAPRRGVDEAVDVADVPATDSADGSVLGDERDQRLQAAKQALDRAVAQLDPEDRLIIRMHFFEGLSIADVARGLGVAQKPLYPRIKRILETLSGALGAEGIGAEYVEWLTPASV